ncbi:MAG TPA: proline dehydrogenase family protein [Thermodesulfobacteriota bacterium]|nr:proline dehydrogenase family protein [Thermodesulfobacteriota bacterium]
MKLLTFLAGRYIAGATRGDAIKVVKRLNRKGLLATIDILGENVQDKEEADANTNEYLSLLEDIKKEGVLSTISFKLTHIGLDISDELARKNAEKIIKRTEELRNFARFDMERSGYTQKTLDIFLEVAKKHQNAGIAIQSSLKRSADDIKLLIGKRASVRLVKGAYKEPPDIAFESKKDVDSNFSALMKELLSKGSYPAIATHDVGLIDEAKKFARDNKITKDRFEFQMLLGIKRTLQKKLVDNGYRVRVYVPYGKNWLPYVLRRFRERKENIWFVIKNIFD